LPPVAGGPPTLAEVVADGVLSCPGLEGVGGVAGRELLLKVRVDLLELGVDLLDSACHFDGRAASSDLHVPF
jgi:hypothetical protein